MKMNLQNIESYLLLYIDNELSATERAEVENVITENPTLANELTLLKQTVLTPEPISFEDKALLYRLEEMEASIPSAFKQSLYREEASVVNGFFNRYRMIGFASIAAMLLLLIGYRIHFTETIIDKKVMSQNTNNPLTSKKNSKDFMRVGANDIIENNALTKDKIKTMVVADRKMFTSNNIPPNKEVNFIQQETKQTGAIVKETETKNPIVAENTIAQIPENNTPAAIESVNSNLSNNNTTNETQEDYNNVNTNEQDHSIYIANFEIDGDKLRGFSRRINALLKRNKNDKQK